MRTLGGREAVAAAAPRADTSEVHLVGGAAGPLGGDDLRLDVDIGARVRWYRSGRSRLQLGPARPARSRVRVAITDATSGRARSSTGASEPLISVAGSDHRMTTVLRGSTPGASRRAGRTSIVLGRSAEHLVESRPGCAPSSPAPSCSTTTSSSRPRPHLRRSRSAVRSGANGRARRLTFCSSARSPDRAGPPRRPRRHPGRDPSPACRRRTARPPAPRDDRMGDGGRRPASLDDRCVALPPGPPSPPSRPSR